MARKSGAPISAWIEVENELKRKYEVKPNDNHRGLAALCLLTPSLLVGASDDEVNGMIMARCACWPT